MAIDDRDSRIRAEWGPWRKSRHPNKEKPTVTQAMAFFSYIRAKEPDLLDHNFPGDKWQEFKILLKRLDLVIEDHEEILKRGGVGGTQMPDYDPMDVAQWLEAWFISHVTSGPKSEDRRQALQMAMEDALFEHFPGLSEEMVRADGPVFQMFAALLQRHSATKH